MEELAQALIEQARENAKLLTVGRRSFAREVAAFVMKHPEIAKACPIEAELLLGMCQREIGA